MDNWVARQHILLQVAQAHQHQSDSHLLVEYPRIMEYPVHSYVLFTPPVRLASRTIPSNGSDKFDLHNRRFSVRQADHDTYPQPLLVHL